MDWADRRVMDVALAVGIGALQLFGTALAAQNQPDARQLDALGVLLLGSGALALIARRRYPVAVFAAAFATTFTYELLGFPGGPIWGTLIVAYVTVVTTGRRLAGYAGIVLGYTSIWWLPAVSDEPMPGVGEALAFAAWMLVLIAATEVWRVRRAYVAEAEQARRSEQRVAIARDLHDVLAHSISLINVQASSALHLLDSKPEQARPALEAIKRASGEALTEVRGVLETLRRPDDGTTSKAPAPTLARIDDLTAEAQAAGLDIETIVEGTPRSLPATVELAAYRICQEAVTNVIRHAGPATAQLKLHYRENELVVGVSDDGRGANGTSGGGNGLPGMQERASALGGSLQAGPRPTGGFRVEARLPLSRADWRHA
jgi:signal transduction histidine kinase